MKTIKSYGRQLALTAALAVAGTLATAQEDSASLMDRLPDNAIIAVGISDFQEMKQKFEGSRFYDAWMSPEMADTRTLTSETYAEMSDEFENSTGIEFERLSRYFEKEAAIALLLNDRSDVTSVFEEGQGTMMMLSRVDMDDKESIMEELNIMAEQMTDEEIEKSSYTTGGTNVRRMAATINRSYEEYDYSTGDTVTVEDVVTDITEYAFIEEDSVLVMVSSNWAEKEEILAPILAAYENRGTPNLGNQPSPSAASESIFNDARC